MPRPSKQRRATTEAWLHSAIKALSPLVRDAIASAPEWVAAYCARPLNIQVGVGYDNDDAKRLIAGVTLTPESCVDKETHTILFSPDLLGRQKHVTVILAVILHELIHTWVEEKMPHGRAFQEVAFSCGFRKPYAVVNAETISNRLASQLRDVARKVGRCPWRPLR